MVAKMTALCSELSVEADLSGPHFFDMCSDTRMIGGPNPDGRYLLAMIRGDRTYRVTGTRGSTAYLGFQVLAGTGLTPRRMAGYSATPNSNLDSGDVRAGVLRHRAAGRSPRLGTVGAPSRRTPRRSSCASTSATSRTPNNPRPCASKPSNPMPLRPITDDDAAEQFTAMAWTIVKLATMHRTIKPELLDAAQQLVTAEAAELGGADTTPDNLYMIGTFALRARRVAGARVPAARHQILERHAGEHLARMPRAAAPAQLGHQQGAYPGGDGIVRIGIGAKDFGHGHWLDTGGRRRGFIVLRWLDNPEPPDVRTRVLRGEAVS